MVTVGISTNTRLVSVAIFAQGELLEYFTHLHKSSWSPVKREEIITSLEPCVRQYCIKNVVLSIPYAHHQTEAFKSLIEGLQDFFKKHNISVHIKTPEALTSFCEEGKKNNKKEMMQEVAIRFPELRNYYQKELRNKNRYYFKLFEAVAVAVLGSNDM